MRSRLRARVAAILLGTLGLAALSACGSDAADAANLPKCLQSLKAVTLPSDDTFPKDWPFPKGTVITATEEVPGGGLAVTIGSG